MIDPKFKVNWSGKQTLPLSFETHIQRLEACKIEAADQCVFSGQIGIDVIPQELVGGTTDRVMQTNGGVSGYVHLDVTISAWTMRNATSTQNQWALFADFGGTMRMISSGDSSWEVNASSGVVLRWDQKSEIQGLTMLDAIRDESQNFRLRDFVQWLVDRQFHSILTRNKKVSPFEQPVELSFSPGSDAEYSDGVPLVAHHVKKTAIGQRFNVTTVRMAFGDAYFGFVLADPVFDSWGRMDTVFGTEWPLGAVAPAPPSARLALEALGLDSKTHATETVFASRAPASLYDRADQAFARLLRGGAP